MNMYLDEHSQGGVLICMTILGLFLNGLELYFLLFKLKLPHNQNIFLINVATVDYLMSAVGLVRGKEEWETSC